MFLGQHPQFSEQSHLGPQMQDLSHRQVAYFINFGQHLQIAPHEQLYLQLQLPFEQSQRFCLSEQHWQFGPHVQLGPHEQQASHATQFFMFFLGLTLYLYLFSQQGQFEF